MKLLRYGRPVGTVFNLLGSKEDHMTYALGFVASRSRVSWPHCSHAQPDAGSAVRGRP